MGRYASTRRALDSDFHGRYSEARQHVQDSIVSFYLTAGALAACTSARPWLIYTAGAMGSGKTHTTRWLASEGALPLHRFVRVSSDAIKSLLPEMKALVASHRELAGTLSHAESRLIAEILLREALAAGCNVLVDGSLRHVEWQEREIARVRAEHPAYRIAIIYVSASPLRVYERATRRSAVTGRVVPRETLDLTMRAAPAAFGRLAPAADFTAVIANDDDAPPRVMEPSSIEEIRRRLALEEEEEEPLVAHLGSSKKEINNIGQQQR